MAVVKVERPLACPDLKLPGVNQLSAQKLAKISGLNSTLFAAAAIRDAKGRGD
jgi:hypothetical protein